MSLASTQDTMSSSAQASQGPAAAENAAHEREAPDTQPNGVSDEDRLVDRLLDRLGQLGLVQPQQSQPGEPEPQQEEEDNEWEDPDWDWQPPGKSSGWQQSWNWYGHGWYAPSWKNEGESRIDPTSPTSTSRSLMGSAKSIPTTSMP